MQKVLTVLYFGLGLFLWPFLLRMMFSQLPNKGEIHFLALLMVGGGIYLAFYAAEPDLQALMLAGIGGFFWALFMTLHSARNMRSLQVFQSIFGTVAGEEYYQYKENFRLFLLLAGGTFLLLLGDFWATETLDAGALLAEAIIAAYFALGVAYSRLKMGQYVVVA